MIARIDLGGVNCYLLKAKDGFILADTGGHMVMDKTFTNRREALPGHTAGSVGILTAEGGLIAGDMLANTKKPAPSPNALDFRQLAESVRRLQKLPIKTVYPRYGEPFAFEKIKQ